jgi:hypothetical protein
MSARYVAERGLQTARPMKKTFSALPILLLAAIAIVVSIHSVGCGDDCKTTRGGSEVCD